MKLRALQNVANQFEVLPLNQRVVVLNNYNFDYVINGKRDVLVLFYSSEAKEENEFLTVYVSNSIRVLYLVYNGYRRLS